MKKALLTLCFLSALLTVFAAQPPMQYTPWTTNRSGNGVTINGNGTHQTNVVYDDLTFLAGGTNLYVESVGTGANKTNRFNVPFVGSGLGFTNQHLAHILDGGTNGYFVATDDGLGNTNYSLVLTNFNGGSGDGSGFGTNGSFYYASLGSAPTSGNAETPVFHSIFGEAHDIVVEHVICEVYTPTLVSNLFVISRHASYPNTTYRFELAAVSGATTFTNTGYFLDAVSPASDNVRFGNTNTSGSWILQPGVSYILVCTNDSGAEQNFNGVYGYLWSNGGGGGGGLTASQTPWLTDINGNQKALTNATSAMIGNDTNYLSYGVENNPFYTNQNEKVLVLHNKDLASTTNGFVLFAGPDLGDPDDYRNLWNGIGSVGWGAVWFRNMFYDNTSARYRPISNTNSYYATCNEIESGAEGWSIYTMTPYMLETAGNNPVFWARNQDHRVMSGSSSVTANLSGKPSFQISAPIFIREYPGTNATYVTSSGAVPSLDYQSSAQLAHWNLQMNDSSFRTGIVLDFSKGGGLPNLQQRQWSTTFRVVLEFNAFKTDTTMTPFAQIFALVDATGSDPGGSLHLRTGLASTMADRLVIDQNGVIAGNGSGLTNTTAFVAMGFTNNCPFATNATAILTNINPYVQSDTTMLKADAATKSCTVTSLVSGTISVSGTIYVNGLASTAAPSDVVSYIYTNGVSAGIIGYATLFKLAAGAGYIQTFSFSGSARVEANTYTQVRIINVAPGTGTQWDDPGGHTAPHIFWNLTR